MSKSEAILLQEGCNKMNLRPNTNLNTLQADDTVLGATICLCAAIDDLGRSVCDKLGSNLQVRINFYIQM